MIDMICIRVLVLEYDADMCHNFDDDDDETSMAPLDTIFPSFLDLYVSYISHYGVFSAL